MLRDKTDTEEKSKTDERRRIMEIFWWALAAEGGEEKVAKARRLPRREVKETTLR